MQFSRIVVAVGVQGLFSTGEIESRDGTTRGIAVRIVMPMQEV